MKPVELCSLVSSTATRNGRIEARMGWLRLYDDIIDDPKVLQLSWEFRWHFVEILAISSRQKVRGTLPNVEQIAIHMRTNVARTERIVSHLVDLGFIDVNPETGILSVHGWDGRQFESDNVTARTRAFRERSRLAKANVPGNVPDTFPACARAETETETEKKNTYLLREPYSASPTGLSSPAGAPTPAPASPHEPARPRTRTRTPAKKFLASMHTPADDKMASDPVLRAEFEARKPSDASK